MLTDRLNLENFPTSPYAQELRTGLHALRFGDVLEAEYRTVHVARMRYRVRLWYTVNFALALLFTAETIGTLSFKPPITWVDLTLWLPAAGTLTGLVWSAQYSAYFLRGARTLGVLAGMLTAVGAVLTQATQGQAAGFLELELMGAFFLSGLFFKEAFASACAFLASYTLAALFIEPALAQVPRLLVGALTVAMASLICRDTERAARRGFLETALANELVALDGLTGLANRRAFDAHLMTAWQQALREERAIAVLLIDLDHFKAFNDTRGHQAGDLALRRVAQQVQGFARRPLDLAARYGGEELALILYDPTRSEVREHAERLRLSIATLPVCELPERARVTVSIGAAFVQPQRQRSVLGAVQLADEALYEAKNHTRNCVVLKDADAYAHLRTGAFQISKPVSAVRRGSRR